MKLLKLALASTALAFATPVVAQEYPLDPAEYVEISGIHIDDGFFLTYADHLSGIWRKGQDFAMEQGWITGYEILVNVHAREGEPDIYLMTRFTDWSSPEEDERREAMYMELMDATNAEMAEASAGRAEYRTQGSDMLLRRYVWAD